MITYVAFLRGINVGGQKKIVMTDLRMLFEQQGLFKVTTYIQSGNVIFKSELSALMLTGMIQQAIRNAYNFDVPVLVVTAMELKRIAAACPYIGNTDLANIHLTLLEKVPDKQLFSSILPDYASNDEFHWNGCAIYLHCPNGYGRTKLTNTFFESKLKVKATTRNWKTVLKVIQLTEELESIA